MYLHVCTQILIRLEKPEEIETDEADEKKGFIKLTCMHVYLLDYYITLKFGKAYIQSF